MNTSLYHQPYTTCHNFLWQEKAVIPSTVSCRNLPASALGRQWAGEESSSPEALLSQEDFSSCWDKALALGTQ